MKKTLITAALMLAFGAANAAGLTNGGFEDSNVGTDAYLYSEDQPYSIPVVASPWDFEGRSGVSSGSNLWGGTAVEGSNYGFLQKAGSSISQSFSGGAGLYTIAFSLAQRLGDNFYPGAQSISVFFDSSALQLVGQLNPTVINAPLYVQGEDEPGGWTNYSFSVASANPVVHTLSFVGLGWNGKDTTTFVDNVSVTAAVPEPETYAMLLAGLGLMGAIARRRNKKQA